MPKYYKFTHQKHIEGNIYGRSKSFKFFLNASFNGNALEWGARTEVICITKQWNGQSSQV